MIHPFIKKTFLYAGIMAAILSAISCKKDATTSSTGSETASANKMDWWREARFGMFIHWGVYSVPGGIYHGQPVNGYGEWIMNDAHIPRSEYAGFAQQFNPTKYDPDAWVQMAKNAGMKYIVITSKHHDGFALFDTKASSWNMIQATPYAKDILKPLADACRKYGIKLGFYYSQANDWYNPGGAAEYGHWDPTQNGSMDDYIDNVAIPEVKEILSDYGDVSVIWWDVPTDMTTERAAKFNTLLKQYPNIITNDRLGGGFNGDYTTPEQYVPSTGPGRDWETCMTMNGTWGYKINDNDWKSPLDLISTLVDIASKGGNFLLNIGPKPTGEFPQESIDRLKIIGQWMHTNSSAIYGTTASPFKQLDWGRCTKKVSAKSATLYLHVFNWPTNGSLFLPGLSNKIASAKLLVNNTAITTTVTDAGVILHVPLYQPDAIIPVIEVTINEPLNVIEPSIAAISAGVFNLTADDADVHNDSTGNDIHIENNPPDIGYWTNPNNWVSWNMKVTDAGTYNVKVLAGTPSAQSQFTINVAGQTMNAVITSTGDYNNYQLFDAGTVTFSNAGNYTLSLKPDVNGWNAINVQQVQLFKK
jgi:alpha-L-fucosidase